MHWIKEHLRLAAGSDVIVKWTPSTLEVFAFHLLNALTKHVQNHQWNYDQTKSQAHDACPYSNLITKQLRFENFLVRKIKKSTDQEFHVSIDAQRYELCEE